MCFEESVENGGKTPLGLSVMIVTHTHTLAQHFCLGVEDGRLATLVDSSAGKYLSGLRRCGVIYEGMCGQ